MQKPNALITPGQTKEPLEDGRLGQLADRFRHALRKDRELTNADIQELNESSDNILEEILVGATKKALAKVRRKEGKCLKKVGSVMTPTQDTFDAGSFFMDVRQPQGIRLYLWPNFKAHFAKKLEQPIEGMPLAYHDLTEDTRDGKIIRQLGGEAQIETYLSQIAWLIARQANGPDSPVGPLLTNGSANIFYVRDDQGVLWAVHAHWFVDSRDWRLCAVSVAPPPPWYAGDRVFSRDSSAS